MNTATRVVFCHNYSSTMGNLTSSLDDNDDDGGRANEGNNRTQNTHHGRRSLQGRLGGVRSRREMRERERENEEELQRKKDNRAVRLDKISKQWAGAHGVMISSRASSKQDVPPSGPYGCCCWY